MSLTNRHYLPNKEADNDWSIISNNMCICNRQCAESIIGEVQEKDEIFNDIRSF